jgi:SAM-dependent methyltransferase
VTAIPSPNIWGDPDRYEVENLGADPEGVIDRVLGQVADWRGRVVLDIGCGTGFHLPGLAAQAAAVIGVEPHPPLVRRAADRVAALRRTDRTSAPVAVLCAGAQALPIADSSIDVAVARWAYFFGAGCEPGLAELHRVLRPGAVAAIVDNDASRSTFGGWFRRAYPTYDVDAVERFWRRHGWCRETATMRWEFPSPADLAAVLFMEFPQPEVERILEELGPRATGVDYAVAVRWRRF